MAAPKTTQDNFHRGRFTLIQPSDGAHRSGIDALLLASCVHDGFDGHVADLGAGSGAAGMAVLSRCARAEASLFELSDVMVDYAEQTRTHIDNALFKERLSIYRADITANGEDRAQHGLSANSFDWVIANPPFNSADDRKSPNSERAFAHVMDGNTIEIWSRTAASICKPSGYFSMIVRPQSMGEILAAYQGRFGGLRITAVHPRPGEDAIRILVTGKKGSKQRLEITPALTLHNLTGRDFTVKADALINGTVSLEKSLGENV